MPPTLQHLYNTVLSICHIGKGWCARRGRCTFQPPEDGHNHPSGCFGVWAEGGFTCAGHEAVFTDIPHCIGIPGVRGYIGKGDGQRSVGRQRGGCNLVFGRYIVPDGGKGDGLDDVAVGGVRLQIGLLRILEKLIFRGIEAVSNYV